MYIPQILIIDDDQSWREDLRYNLLPSRYQFKDASSLEEAVKLISNIVFDLIILNIQIDPNITNEVRFAQRWITLMSLIKRVNQQKHTRIHTIVVASQSYPLSVDINNLQTMAFRDYGVENFFIKEHFKIDEYRETVEKLLNQKFQKPTSNKRKENSMDAIVQQRLKILVENLEIAYEKLGEFEQELIITGSKKDKFDLKQRIKRECLPDIRKYEAEYTMLLAENVDALTLSDADAEEVMLALQNAIDQKALPTATAQPQEVTQAIVKAQEALKQPNVSAKNKLKMTLPLIPGILSYEIEVDPSGAFVNTWQNIKKKFKR